jgi:hypothetical protein
MNKANSGVVILHADADRKVKTVIVLGVPRGGTSMVAGILSKLGVFMGEAENLAPFYENVELGQILKVGDKTKITEIIDHNNSTYIIWGTKILPQRFIRWWLYRSLFSQVAYVVVFRDILATAKRRSISMNGGLLKEMFKAAFINLGLLTLISFTKKPVLLLSYEKALLFPEEIVADLSTFLNINDESKQEEAIEFIKPSPVDYRIRSTTSAKLNTKLPYFGYIDKVMKDQIIGWVLSLENNNAMTVELLINGILEKTSCANLIREDVKNANGDFHQHCGFEFSFAEPDYLKPGDCIEVRLAEERIHLINSPYYFN